MPPSKPNPLSKSDYSALRSDLKNILRHTRADETEAQDHVTTLAYWKIGQRISRERLEKNLSYHNTILRELADDLNVSLRTLQYASLFYTVYHIAPKSSHLTWSHYRHLIYVKNPKARAHYEELVLKNRISARELKAAITNGHYEKIHDAPSKNAPRLSPPKKFGYCYRAWVHEIVDADTVIFNIDLGFHTVAQQSLRLAGIDAYEPDTTTGKLAKRFVSEQLCFAQSIVVQTQTQDIHGRFIAHVHYSPNNASIDDTVRNGIYLNQELLNRGLAHLL